MTVKADVGIGENQYLCDNDRQGLNTLVSLICIKVVKTLNLTLHAILRRLSCLLAICIYMYMFVLQHLLPLIYMYLSYPIISLTDDLSCLSNYHNDDPIIPSTIIHLFNP